MMMIKTSARIEQIDALLLTFPRSDILLALHKNSTALFEKRIVCIS